ncbi:MAG: hypothetical protein LBT54_04655 [Bifidobacteriaceae bacterium]|jgi:hypothetical protein|nr:hypothetical protein [Bifidobacteriaceae bacterium]
MTINLRCESCAEAQGPCPDCAAGAVVGCESGSGGAWATAAEVRAIAALAAAGLVPPLRLGTAVTARAA